MAKNHGLRKRPETKASKQNGLSGQTLPALPEPLGQPYKCGECDSSDNPNDNRTPNDDGPGKKPRRAASGPRRMAVLY